MSHSTKPTQKLKLINYEQLLHIGPCKVITSLLLTLSAVIAINYSNSNSCQIFLLRKAIAKGKVNLIAIDFKTKKEQQSQKSNTEKKP